MSVYLRIDYDADNNISVIFISISYTYRSETTDRTSLLLFTKSIYRQKERLQRHNIIIFGKFADTCKELHPYIDSIQRRSVFAEIELCEQHR